MIVLGMQEAHDASAALMIDGKIVAAAQEERFTGLKGDYGFPERSIESMLAHAGVRPSDIDEVVLASHKWNPVLTKIKRNANFSVDDWVKEQREYWKPVLLEGGSVDYYALFKDRPGWSYDEVYAMEDLLKGYMDEQEMAKMADLRQRTVAERLGIPPGRVRTITHEDAHTFYAYFGSPMRGEVLALTSEGFGDYSNGTVSVFDDTGRRELASSAENHLGHIYQYVTLLLGMKPAQHEYKVMGLAPYANSKELEKSYEIFKDVLKVDGLNIVYDRKPDDLYFWFRDRLEGHRFDGIAGAAQKLVEDVLCRWVEACVGETGIRRLVFSGGVAQNIKAAKCIAELDCVDEIYVCPAAGDTSLSIGACYLAAFERAARGEFGISDIEPLDDIYLGPRFGDDEIDDALRAAGIADSHRVIEGPTPEQVATHIADGLVIARCSGRMEFGLRALGNRSILADPRRPSTVPKINAQIKFRDFWMPFTPTILAEREADYIVNPKGLLSPFMAMAFDATPLAHGELIAALHPGDFTARPQILEERRNPGYYAIIKAFEEITGVGGVLNTSFNLHGDPIALGPREAIHTFQSSELDGLLMEDRLIMRGRAP